VQLKFKINIARAGVRAHYFGRSRHICRHWRHTVAYPVRSAELGSAGLDSAPACESAFQIILKRRLTCRRTIIVSSVGLWPHSTELMCARLFTRLNQLHVVIVHPNWYAPGWSAGVNAPDYDHHPTPTDLRQIWRKCAHSARRNTRLIQPGVWPPTDVTDFHHLRPAHYAAYYAGLWPPKLTILSVASSFAPDYDRGVILTVLHNENKHLNIDQVGNLLTPTYQLDLINEYLLPDMFC